jgi:hypothetical protein
MDKAHKPITTQCVWHLHMNMKWSANVNSYTIAYASISSYLKISSTLKFCIHFFYSHPTSVIWGAGTEKSVQWLCYGPDNGRIVSGQPAQKVSSKASTPAQVLTQAPIQWLPGSCFPGFKTVSLISFKNSTEVIIFLLFSRGLYLIPNCHFAFPCSQ